MTSSIRHLTLRQARDLLARSLVPPPLSDGIGLELEFLTFPTDDWSRRPTLADIDDLIDRCCGLLPDGVRLTREPGGQLEVVTAPLGDARNACAAAALALREVVRLSRESEIRLVALGVDPARPPLRILDEPRYRAMELHFRSIGGDGLQMMCNTAALQVNLGAGDEQTLLLRWRTTNALAPFLSAVFANSPFPPRPAQSNSRGDSGRLLSHRAAVWSAVEPSRCKPVPVGSSPVDDWIDYVLDADVMLIRRGPSEYVPLTCPFPFRQWLEEGHELGWPDEEDLAYHTTTLFPPVRPRGWLELRALDTLPTPVWHVAVAVCSALLAEEAVMAEVLRWCGALGDAHDIPPAGLSSPESRAVAEALFRIASEGLYTQGATEAAGMVDYWRVRWVARGLTPADELLECGDDFTRALQAREETGETLVEGLVGSGQPRSGSR
ncbi:MAG: glutamate--cysteine ligase EgtA [Acidimicrobiales bacterium]|nr:MAG: glutamate--cysteine ligase EgtA [Acidimicrobiales bacterium]